MSVKENLTRDEAAARASLLGDLHYDVALDLTRGDERFGAVVTVTFTCGRPGATTFIDLTADSVERVVLNGRELGPEQLQPTRVELPQLADRNELVIEATMAYRNIGKGMSFFRDPSDDGVYLHSQFEPHDAHLVFACFDQPDLKATFDIAVAAPAGWVVVSNSPVTDRPGEGAAGRWVFSRTPLIPTYIVAVVAGTYTSVTQTHDGMELGWYIRRSLAEHLEADELFELTRQGLDWYAEAFGMAYPFEKYDQLFVPEFQAGAMENPGCITYSEAYVFRSKVTQTQRERRAETILHEMAHMWFGDLVTMRWWDDLWLNESFATFMSVLCQSRATRFRNAWVTFLDAEKTWAKFQDQLPTTHPIAADMVDIQSVHQNFDGITYAKGASVLRQLVAWVGEDAFLAGCRRYFDQHAWANAELQDFLEALEETSGRDDLKAWRDEWLRTTGVNTLAADYELDDEGRFRSFAVHQTAVDEHPTLRRHRVGIGIYARGGDGIARTSRVEVDVTDGTTEVPELVGVAAGDVVLVNDDDLTYSKIRIDRRSMDVLTQDLDQLVEPLPRALVWSAAWDMVRDGDLPARRFADLVGNNVASETEVGVLQRLLARAVAAADRYGDPANRDAVHARLAGQARRELDAAAPGSDHQLSWAKHWATTGARGEQAGDVRAVLDGELRIDGLEMDTDLRWWFVNALAANGVVDADVIDAEYERDPTDIGERQRAGALAARPTAAAKAEAWRRLREEDLSLTVSRDLWSGFSQLHQPELARDYVEAYFEALTPVFAERPLDWAIEFAEDVYPHAAASPDLLERTDAVLAGDDLPAPLRRALVEQRDTLRRTLVARAADRDGA
ncbi:MAG: aminopeptidase N [Actinobacteria bacterium]|nr:aminopeptidase N [Actinomycetota bacterium]